MIKKKVSKPTTRRDKAISAVKNVKSAQPHLPGMDIKGQKLNVVAKDAKTTEKPSEDSKLTKELKEGNRPMFMTGNEIKSNYRPNMFDLGSNETNDELWSRKLQESRGGNEHNTNYSVEENVGNATGAKSLYESVKAEGIKTPVRLTEFRIGGAFPQVRDGHHRIASAASANPEMMIPIEYTRD